MNIKHINKPNGLSSIIFNFEGNLLEQGLLTTCSQEVFNFLYRDTSSTRKFFCLVKFQDTNGAYKTLGCGVILEHGADSSLTEHLLSFMNHRSNDYLSVDINKLIFEYFLIPVDREKYYQKNRVTLRPSSNKDILFPLQDIKLSLPSNTDYLTWGYVVVNTPEIKVVVNKKGETFKIYPTHVEVIVNENIFSTFNVQILSGNTFSRSIGNVTYLIKDGEIIRSEISKTTKFLSPLKPKKEKEIKIITFDIETVLRDGKMVPYLYSMFDGNNTYSFFSESPKPLFDQLLRSKYRDYKVYSHNLSGFDSVFIFKYLAKLSKEYQVRVIKRDSNIISIKIINRKRNISITILDSLLLLPGSLADWAKSFEIKTQKQIEPVLVSTDDGSGSAYVQQDLSHYTKEVSKYTCFADWKLAIQSYCEADCLALYQVLILAKELIYKDLQVNIEDYPTTPSLSFAIFRTLFLKHIEIPITNGDVYQFLKTSFTGGSTEMYKPQGENIYEYDVNSLYPSVMKDNLFPVGRPTQFHIYKGQDLSFLEGKFWIADCLIETKSDLYQPYLQIHHDSGSGLRTIAANGTFTMRLTSVEYYNALKDYNIQVSYGYYFDQKPIFKEFMNTLYSLRLNYPKDHPMNKLVKLIMNSLFGRFGMNPVQETQEFVSFNSLADLAQNFIVRDCIDLDEEGYFATYLDPDSLGEGSNTSVGIAPAITSYARVYMSKFKNNSEFNLYYTDTDSIFVDKPLPEDLIGDDIGQFKLVHKFKEIVFLSPKVYSGITVADDTVTKIKGYKNASSVPFSDLKGLLKANEAYEYLHYLWFKDLDLSRIVFSYINKDGIAEDTHLLLQEPKYEVTTYNFNNMRLPLTMDPNKYGDIIATQTINDGNITRYVIDNNNTMFVIDVSENGTINTVTIKGPSDLKWIDRKISENVFKREIGKDTIYIKDGEVIVKEKELNAKPFKNVAKDSKLASSNSFMTMDIETVNIDGHLHPYLICAYTKDITKGDKYITSYATDISLEAQSVMFNNFIKQILDYKNVQYVYAHNLSGFDGIFLLKHLISYEGGKVEPLLFNGKLISIKFKISEGTGTNKKVRTITFKDSYLLLPIALRKLCVSFDVPQIKGHFPFGLDDINYVGPLPDITYWPDLTSTEYDSISSSFEGSIWSFRDEAIKYCQLDCKCLFDVLVKFNDLVFNEFKINIHSSLTLPSLAMKIYKALYMPKDTIYQLLGDVEEDIRQSYTGGAVDVYLTHNSQQMGFGTDHREKLFYYDINSLYPYVMSTLEMPVGKPIAFEGDILSINPDAYGFFYCKITSPNYLEHPIIQRRIKTSNGYRTIAGLGSWEGWIFSRELQSAKKLGYQFEILKGYQFERKIIFKEYVEKMYNLRLEYSKSDPMNLIAKLLMNSLYGKFGMKPESTQVDVFPSNNAEALGTLYEAMKVYPEYVKDIVELDGSYVLVRKNIANYKHDESLDMFHGLDVNIAIASPVTGGARVWMSQVKNDPKFNLYYSDTDSIIIDRELPDFMVSDKLGYFKLECEISRAVFLAPKVYGLITTSGEEIIKVKGITSKVVKSIHINDLEKLLLPNSSMEVSQNKWLKKVITGDISISEVAYNLKATSNKRMPIYIDGIYSQTRPYSYSEIEK